ncbi:hypothetical protein Y032_0167g143 [Ancylostoma ceylanicum]|uniref:Uncharacterized protein n=1 Tax=Ancylostoma ceylanicum TaxID=53326 RepID=A0A016SWE4_9BILA|nr:hypothetical protein Y032_0167g143 [Ancylostoma ceylanicum]
MGAPASKSGETHRACRTVEEECARVEKWENAEGRVQRSDKDAPASECGETPGAGSNGRIRVHRRPKGGTHRSTDDLRCKTVSIIPPVSFCPHHTPPAFSTLICF